MPTWDSYSFIFGPLVAFLGIGIMVVILKWGFGKKSSLIQRPVTQGKQDQYGLMIPLFSPKNLIEGEMQRRFLIDSGFRINLASTLDGARLMVWPEDLTKAKKIISENPQIFHV